MQCEVGNGQVGILQAAPGGAAGCSILQAAASWETPRAASGAGQVAVSPCCTVSQEKVMHTYCLCKISLAAASSIADLKTSS